MSMPRIGLAILTCLLLAGCGPSANSFFGSIKPGMTKAEVKKLFGPPDERGGDPAGSEWWGYHDGLTVLCVEFDEAGLVDHTWS